MDTLIIRLLPVRLGGYIFSATGVNGVYGRKYDSNDW